MAGSAISTDSARRPLSPISHESGRDLDRAPGDVVVNVEESELEVSGEEVDKHEGIGNDEGQVPNVLACPGQPTKEERRKHNCTHIPYRAWCDHCVRGRGRNRAARNICGSYNAAKGLVPRVHADYAFFSVNANGDECDGEEAGSRVVLKI